MLVLKFVLPVLALAATPALAAEFWATWEPSAGATEYRIVYKSDLSERLEAVTQKPEFQFSLPVGEVVKLWVAACNQDGCSGYAGASLRYVLPNADWPPPINIDMGLVETIPPSSYALRVNAGGPEYTDSAGNTWAADTGFNTGRTSQRVLPIEGTADDALFHAHRWDPSTGAELAYAFTVPNGDYQVRLHFAETYSGTFGVGKRVFDVRLEDTPVLDNLDVYAEVGANTALTQTFAVTVTDGQLNLGFVHEVENPMISALEIIAR